MCLKEELAWATDKHLWVNCFLNGYTTKELKNKVILRIKNIVSDATYMVLSNVFYLFQDMVQRL